MWGVEMTGGLRKVATSCGDGPDAAIWFCDRWLICDCCCAMRFSSLSRRASGSNQPPVLIYACWTAGIGRLATGNAGRFTYQAHAHIQLAGLVFCAEDTPARSRQLWFPLVSCDINLHMSNGSSSTNHLQGTDQRMIEVEVMNICSTYTLDDRDRT